MKFPKSLAAAASAAAVLFAPMPAAAAGSSEAEDIRRLDIMLMVTSLRCRMGANDFQPHYQRFSANHLAALNSAARSLQAGLVREHGNRGAKRALDRISVGIANEYGQGHPWLGCAELKEITADLAATPDSSELGIAAVELLAATPRKGGCFAAR